MGGFISALATLGLGAIAKELWKLRRLRQHFSVQEQAQILMENDAVCQGQAFCEQIAKQGKVDKQGYQRWLSALNSSHSDAEILDLYDALVVGEQDKQASQIVTRYATEAAALVAISPLAIADMLLVAWRNFSMVDQLAKVYGVELGYWSRIKLFKAVLLNMALAGRVNWLLMPAWICFPWTWPDAFLPVQGRGRRGYSDRTFGH